MGKQPAIQPQDAAMQDGPQDAPAPAVTVAKVAKGISARTLARIATERLGRATTDKRVRSVARDTIERFQDEAYTAHSYTPAEAAGLLAAMSAKGRGGASMTDDEASAAIAALDSVES